MINFVWVLRLIRHIQQMSESSWFSELATILLAKLFNAVFLAVVAEVLVQAWLCADYFLVRVIVVLASHSLRSCFFGILDQFYEFFLMPIPFDLEPLPVIDFEPAILQLPMAHIQLLIQLFFLIFLLLQLFSKTLVLCFEFMTFLHDLIQPIPNILHLLLHRLHWLSLGLSILNLRTHGLKFLQMPSPQRLDQIQQKIRTLTRILLLRLQNVLIVVDRKFNLILQWFYCMI